jgi:cytochrome c oxidase subunit 4
MFIVLTLVKAGYIIMSFMHLGEERKNLRNVVLVPYVLFIGYLIFIALYEGSSH